MYSVIHTFLRYSGPRGYRSFLGLNHILIYKNVKVTPRCNFYNFVNRYGIVELEEWSTASIIWAGTFRKGVKTVLWITEGINKSFVI